MKRMDGNLTARSVLCIIICIPIYTYISVEIYGVGYKYTLVLLILFVCFTAAIGDGYTHTCMLD